MPDTAKGPFDGHLAFGSRAALVVIDFVRAYLEPSAPFYARVDEVEQSIARLLSTFRKRHLPVIFTRVRFTHGGTDGGLFYKKVPALRVFDEGSELGEFGELVRPVDGEIVITKQFASAFFGTSLASTLRSLDVDTLVITGVSTSGCVHATAVDAVQSGYVPLVVREGVGDRDEGPHEANLYDLQLKYAEVVSEREIFSWLDRLGD